MIYDKLENIERYRGMSVWLDQAIDFLTGTDLAALPLGRTEINGAMFCKCMEARRATKTRSV